MEADGYLCGDGFIIYTNIKLLCNLPEINMILYVNYLKYIYIYIYNIYIYIYIYILNTYLSTRSGAGKL